MRRVQSLYLAFLGLFLLAGGAVLLVVNRHRDLGLLLCESLLLAPAIWIALRHAGVFPPSWRVPLLPVRALAFLVFALSVAVGILVLQKVTMGDEASYLFQARIFRSGHMVAEPPPDVMVGGRRLYEFFRFQHLFIDEHHWISMYPPLWPAVLAVALLFHAEWLVNPLLAAVYAYFAFRSGEMLYGRATAALGILLLAISPAFLNYSGTLLSHATCAAALSAATCFCLIGRKTGRVAPAIASTALVMLAALARPYTAACFGIGLIPWTLASLWRTPRRLVRYLIGAGAAAVTAAALLFSYNLKFEGRLVGYGSETQKLFTLAPQELEMNISVLVRWSLQSMAFYMVPLTMILAVAALAVERNAGARRNGYFLASLFVPVMVGLFFFPNLSGAHFGERYYYETYFALTLLAARGFAVISKQTTSARFSVAPAAAVPLLCVYALHASQYVRLAHAEMKAPAAILALGRGVHESGSVVYFPFPTGQNCNINQADWKNAPVLYLDDAGQWRGAVAAALGRPNVWRIDVDPVTRDMSLVKESGGAGTGLTK